LFILYTIIPAGWDQWDFTINHKFAIPLKGRTTNEIMNETQNSSKTIALPLVLCLGLAGGLLIGMNLRGGSIRTEKNSEYQKLKEVFGLIEKEYVDETKSDELIEETIEHLLSKLDPHSLYHPISEKLAVAQDLQGSYDGIGIEFNIFRDTLAVATVLSGGPSEAVGLQTGDKIVQVDGKNIASINLKTADVFKLLKGPKGSEVKIHVLRKNKAIDFKIIRDKIPQNSVDAAYMIEPETGYIKLRIFSRETSSEFRTALSTLLDMGMKRLIVDLQDNGGGSLADVAEVADEFLSEGNMIVETKGKDTRFNESYRATANGIFEKGDLIVLIDEGSASASEILSGTLQDNDRALIVGRRSFGKGLVQTMFDLSDGSQLRLTISRYYTPSGRSIQKPYDVYPNEFATRYNHGELFHADSIKFNDSLQYKTANGRTVYGGGGIMPDYFVPLDTTLMSDYLMALYTSNSIQEYTVQYASANKSTLENMDWDDFYSKFTVTDQMLNDLVKVGEANKVKRSPSDVARNKKSFQIHVKANIARKFWKTSGYWQVMNDSNPILQKALHLFDSIPQLSRSKM
jgi:carboxyl-terminal processing protease